MSLIPSTRVGPYEIQSAIGAGGMGEVYRARDSRLGREVAVKVLPESFAADSDRLRRFEHEARAVGALNHPNILSVHDIGARDGIHFIVTELLQGTTLREKLIAGPLPPRRAGEYAMQIAQGLAAAHERGIVHRDLKPENLFITKDARVKILDFGLAKQSAKAQGDDDTLAGSTHTSAGMVLGTVGYMSPEQVRGEAVDHRSDIFAFGAVLYEMLSGQRAFQRGTSVETMSAILKDEPPAIVRTAEREVPPALQRIVHRCLEKDPEQRFQSAKDLSFALETITVGTGETSAVAEVPFTRRWRRVLALALVVLAVAAALGLMLHSLQRDSQQPDYQQVTFRNGYIPSARFTPDGQSIIYAAAWEHPPVKLYSSRVNGSDTRTLELPPGELLAISHSGELAIALQGKTWFGYGSRLARAPLGGGAPRELLDQVVAADWSPDRNGELAIARFDQGKCRVEYPVGKPLYETIGYISHMRISPQGDAIAFMDHPIAGDDRGKVVLVDLKGNNRVLTREWGGEQGLAWSPDGKEIWFTATSGADTDRPLYAVSRSGKQRLILRAPGGLYLEDIAPDGRVLLRHDERRFEVTVAQVRGDSQKLSWLQIMVATSVSRDGKFLVAGDWTSAEYGVYLAKMNGSPAVLLGAGIAGSISPDNQWVTSIPINDTSKIVLLPTSVGETRTVAAANFHYRRAFWAKNGRTLVVQGSESDRPLRFWLQDVPSGSPRAITPEGVDGVFVTLKGSDYIAVRDTSTGTLRLYPIEGGQPKIIAGVRNSDQVIGGSPESNVLYITPDISAVPLQIFKVNTESGVRQLFTTVSPKDPAGVVFLFPPMFTADEKQYVETQIRALSVLYVTSGLR